MNVIESFVDDGHTVFLSTHILPVVEEIPKAMPVKRDGLPRHQRISHDST